MEHNNPNNFLIRGNGLLNNTAKEGIRELLGYACSKCKIDFNKLNPRQRQIHHIDENPTNNCLTNLSLLCSRCHLAHHREGKPGYNLGMKFNFQYPLSIEQEKEVLKKYFTGGYRCSDLAKLYDCSSIAISKSIKIKYPKLVHEMSHIRKNNYVNKEALKKLHLKYGVTDV